MDELGRISWRRFTVLVRCLSPNSATATRLSADNFIGAKRRDAAVPLDTPKAAEAAFQAAFKPG